MAQKHKIIEFGGKYYLADLDYHKLYPVDELFREVFELVESQTDEQIVASLTGEYTEQDIKNCIQWLRSFFERSSVPLLEQTQPKIFAPTPYSKLKSHTIGSSVGQLEILKALSKYAQIHVTQEFEGVDNMVLIPFNPMDQSSASMIIKQNYDGVLLFYVDEFEMMPILNYLQAPVMLPVYAAHGDNGRIINGMLRWYNSMRKFDAFMALSQDTIDYYSNIIQDKSLFHLIPLGVDTNSFYPMDKQSAKNEIAELLSMPEISQKPVVGYVARFEIEKGAGIFVDIARLIPDTIFLAVGPIDDLHNCDFPPNLIHIGIQPRELMPILYNAFDVFCFPSIACNETFGLVVLEAMACGTVPVVSSYDGPKYFVKDAGIVVKTDIFSYDLATLGGRISADDFAKSITGLLQNKNKRQAMAEKARQYALELTWDNSAKMILRLFQKLNSRKHVVKSTRYLPIGFSMSQLPDKTTHSKAIIVNIPQAYNTSRLYDISVEEGIALSLLRRHNMHEIEVVLPNLLQDPDSVDEYLYRIDGLLKALF
ncbi:glycosyltransferase [Candidatus Poribacteria bacterium]|nr:glycosyltransferase [Candidatus Poribacteria bacterium]